MKTITTSFRMTDTGPSEMEFQQNPANPSMKDPSSSSNQSELSNPVLSMSSLGSLGRFGNQVLQYAYLQICAKQSGASIECPEWDGSQLFGLHDKPCRSNLPPAIETWETGNNLFDVLPEYIPFIEKQSGQLSSRAGVEDLHQGLRNVDLWGHFQYHTKHYKPYRDTFRDLFKPVPDLETILEEGFARLNSRGTTVICLHIRRGDLVHNPLFGFSLIPPNAWWKSWLKEIWAKFDQPVLYLCSDDLEEVLSDFEEFEPVTHTDLEIQLPANLKAMDYIIDFHMMSRCQVLAISNSTFSFVAAMLNEHGVRFVRPCFGGNRPIMEFDPWDSPPVLFYDPQKPRMAKPFLFAIKFAYRTGSWKSVLWCLRDYPLAWFKVKVFRSVMAYQISGIPGALRSLCTPLNL